MCSCQLCVTVNATIILDVVHDLEFFCSMILQKQIQFPENCF